MKVFISWSGERSGLIAQTLNSWFPLILHYIQPWMSKEIAAGERWSATIASELATSNYGILCITPENLNSPWVLFEAGALGKSLEDSKVIPLLFHLEFSEIAAPLSQFQAKKLDKIGVKEIVNAINALSESPIPDERLSTLFDALYPQLESEIAKIPESPKEQHARPQSEILEEVVASIRTVEIRLRDIERSFFDGSADIRKNKRRFHSAMIHEIVMSGVENADELANRLLMLAGLLRDEFPWITEILLETSRDLRSAGPRGTRRAIEMLQRSIGAMQRMMPLFDETLSSKDSQMLLMELPSILEHVIHVINVSEDNISIPVSQDTEVRRYKARSGQ